MKKELISKLHSSFELAASQNEDIEFWLARDLQELLGYPKWENFVKAKIACMNVQQEVTDHFLNVRKMVDLGSGAQREWVSAIKEQAEMQKSIFYFKQWETWRGDGIKRKKYENRKEFNRKVYQTMPV